MCTEIQYEGVCREANTARGEAKCCICLETSPSTVFLYADDALLYRNINSEEDITILQQDLNSLSQWAKKWQMNFNPSKYECLRISNKSNLPNLTYYIDYTNIQQVEHAKYLGVTIDQKLNWHEHINVVKKGNSVLGFLRRNLSNLVCISGLVSTLPDRH